MVVYNIYLQYIRDSFHLFQCREMLEVGGGGGGVVGWNAGQGGDREAKEVTLLSAYPKTFRKLRFWVYLDH